MEVIMAYYKNGNYLTQNTNTAFDELHEPGTSSTYSGIYRCAVCGHEVTHVIDKPLPPQNHHEHSPSQGKIRWQLIVSHQ
jgi:hypothetical protein